MSNTLDIQQIRAQFPVLHQEVNGKPLVYFDNAATTQKPQVVIDALDNYYKGYNSNIHRGAHALADKATQAFEETRKTAAKFLNAESPEQVIFTKGTTDGINLIASSYGRQNIQAGDEIIVSTLEHHSNIVPWQMLCQEKGATLKVIPINAKGELIMEEFEKLLTANTKIVAVNHASNALGTVNPIAEMIEKAHAVGAVVVVDGAQSASHFDIDVQALGVDFFVTSAHKIYGPTGIGLLYGKRVLLEEMPPYQGGGEMIKEVSFDGTTFNEIPYKFEAGTPNIADVIAFDAAMKWVQDLGKEAIRAHEAELLAYANEKLSEIPGIIFYGTAAEKVSVLSFGLEGVHPFDIGMMLDARGVAVRTGHHCTQPLMKHLGIEGTVRASFSVYNTKEEIDTLVQGVARVAKMMA
ncbi:aminotransferase class V-fold PLP-dependent enzyme [Persicobacter sp. CCB-QB2]|uniref:aminotransferase class V-fold PLP-dependent enzyme n=1 Tax=Persicobacter sp. CCB-QB2 TaxID=1561025 RepID=UPI0006A9DB96|nr:cysteine desulfurase [Persicobacter sp. CCB-QB2]